MPRLRELIAPETILTVTGSLDREIAHVVTDSRAVGPGDLFICLPGYRTEGGETRADRHDFIPMAVARGAAALVVERTAAAPPDVTVIRVSDCWASAAAVASRYYGAPSSELIVVGVTGTSGKTSTTYFVEAVLRAAGHRVARLGTIEYRIGDEILPAAQTTPEAPLLHRLLRDAVRAGCTAAVMEVSSHALELRRVDGVAFDAAVFTNLSQDHLNFHPDMDHYLRAKGRLFERLGGTGKDATAVVNVDDPASAHIQRVNRGRLVTYGLEAGAALRAHEVQAGLHGLAFTVETPQGRCPVTLRHLGDYSVYNALAAVGVGTALGVDLATMARGLAAAPPVPGRFELVDEGQSFVVVVDYAHKPDALVRLLTSARRLVPRRLITVFGCGGDRDRAKRPVMGQLAVQLSDFVIITSDNPRWEDPGAIIEDILVGARAVDASGTHSTVEVNRAAAIRRAIAMAADDDLIIIAGKGHEAYQLVAGQRLPFDDRSEARTAIRARETARRSAAP
jgi:UDP-N-acetylmuramoyl-L-alanyl-D-glutamate--2,6-diaminopimelate ligase